MPILDTVVGNITKLAIEPISEQIVRRLLTILGIKSIFDDSIFITSDDLKAANFENSEHKKRIPDNRCDVEIIPNYNPLGTIFDAVRARSIDAQYYAKRWVYGDYPLFRDPRALINLYEVTVPCSVELKISLKVKNIEISDFIATTLFSQFLTGGAAFDYNDIQFAYGLPTTIIELLGCAYNMQDDIKATMTFQQYVEIGSNAVITYMVNRDRPTGDQEIIAQKTNTRVLGRAEYSGDKHGTESIGKVANRYVVEFSYFYQFSKPSIMRISFPIMIYNKLIDKKFIGKPLDMNYEGEAQKQVYPIDAINRFFLEGNNTRIDLSKSYPEIKNITYDDWTRSPAMYQSINSTYQILFVGVLSVVSTTDEETTVNDPDGNPVVDTDNSNISSPTVTLSLSVDLENEVFPSMNQAAVAEIKNVITLLNTNVDAPTTFGDHLRRSSIFDLAIFSNDALIPFDELTLSSDFVLTFTGTPVISTIYRVVISQIIDLSNIELQYVYYILENPTYYQALISSNINYLVSMGYLKLTTDGITKKVTVTMNNISGKRRVYDLINPVITDLNFRILPMKN